MLKRNLKLKTFAIIGVAGMVIVAGILVGLVRLADLAVPEYREQVAAQVSQRLDRPITIGAMDLGWGWQGPVLYLENSALLDAPGGDPVIQLGQLALHFKFWSLLRGHLQPNGVSVTQPEISFYHDTQGHLRLRGMPAGEDELDWQNVAEKLDEFEFMRINNGRVHWQNNQRTYTLDEVDLALENLGQRHELTGSLTPPPELGQQLSLEAFVLASPAQVDQFRAHIYLDGQRLDFKALLAAAGVTAALPETGENNLEIWGDWQQGQFSGARLSLTGAADEPPASAAAPGFAAPPTAAVEQTAGSNRSRLLQAGAGMDFSIAPAESGYVATLDALRGDDRYREQMGGTLRFWPQQQKFEARLQDIPASLLGSGSSLVDADARWQTQGNLTEISLLYDASRPSDTFQGEVTFDNLSAQEAGRGVSLSGLAGTLHFSSTGGALKLRTSDGRFEWPAYLPGGLPLDVLEGEIDWQQEAGGWQIHATDLRWLGEDAVVSGGGNIHIPADSSPEVDLFAQVQAGDLPRILAHIPQDPALPNPRLREWLPKAVLTGRLSRSQVRLRGPLDRFPFAQGGGQFKITADIKNASLNYKPGWPELRDGDGSFVLEGDTLTVDAERAHMLDTAIGPANASVANVREPVLKIDGTVSDADADRLMKFLTNSPLQDKFGRLAQVISISGKADLALDLSIPLKPGLGEIRTDGQIDLKQVWLEHRVLPEPIKDITGTLMFSRQGVRGTDLSGDLLGLPLAADLTPLGGNALAIDASALLRLPRDRDSLHQFVPGFVLDRASGEGVWHAALQVGADGKVSTLDLRSDLTGVRLDLPPPLNKNAASNLPVNVQVAPDRSRIQVAVSDRLNMTLRTGDGKLQSVDMLFGDAAKAAPAGPGLWLGGSLRTLDVPAWQSLLTDIGGPAKSNNDGANSNVQLGLRGADLSIDETLLSGQRMPAVRLQAVPLNAASGWQVQLSGAGAQGTLRWLQAPPGTVGARALLEADLEHLVLRPEESLPPASDEEEQNENQPAFDPARLPVSNIKVDRLNVGGYEQGALEVHARAVMGGVELNELKLSGGALELSAQGDWRREDQQTQAKLNATVTGTGLDSLLRTLGYVPSLRADKTRITADLRIAPNSQGLAPAALNGDIKIRLDDGTLLTVDPGAGRVLGLFNFYALPRRLLLDFRDVVDDGLAFDSIRGDFNIASGIARSDNLRIRMPSAVVRIDGLVNLDERSYDQTVTIVPSVSSGVAVAGTVLGGPAVGAALLLAQKLLEKPIQSLSSVTYRLTGDWRNPTIEDLTADETPPAEQTSPTEQISE